MDKLTFNTITEPSEIELFLEKVESFSDVRLPYSYANKSTIVGSFLHGRLVAGYMLVTHPKFRSLNFIPEAVKSETNLSEIDEYEMMEVNGLWISPAVRDPKLQFRVWMQLVKDIFLSKKKYLLLMCDARNKNIQYLHGLTNPSTIYEGSPHLYSGDSSHRQIRVSYTTRWNAIANLPKYWLELRRRLRRVSIGSDNGVEALART